jgi:hypothetical protein
VDLCVSATLHVDSATWHGTQLQTPMHNILSKQPFCPIGKISPKVEIQNSSFKNEVILEVII